jgi:phosphoserine phosphatase RsbU/P
LIFPLFLRGFNAQHQPTFHVEVKCSCPLGRFPQQCHDRQGILQVCTGLRVKGELHFAEEQRLAALRDYDILDTPREAEFDAVVKVVSAICETPISVINLIDAGRQWFKAEVGLGVREMPIDSSICAHAILQPGLFVVPDTTKDERFLDNPLVAGDPRLRFYAGALLETPDGLPLGTICALDYVPRELNEKQQAFLRLMAGQIMKLLELRRLTAREHEQRLRAEALAREAMEAKGGLQRLNDELERRIIERSQVRGRTWQVTPDLLGALNSKGYFETSNPAWKTMLGWTEEEVASMSIFDLLHPDDVERTREGFNLTQEGQPAIQFPNRYRCKDGSYRWISWVGVPEDGMVYCSGRDITEETEAQASLLNERETAALRDQFIAILGHDLRNPIGSIDAGLRLLLRTSLEDKGKELVRLMQNSVGRMSALTSNVLDFARGKLGGGFPIVRTRDRPLKPVLEVVSDELANSYPERRIDLNFAFVDPIDCDRERIGQMFSNLLANALTHGDSSTPICVEATTCDGTFSLSVANSGQPIAPAIMNELFLPFRRGDGHASKQGLGLGLFIASEIARAHCGALTVSSTEQETKFTFQMPLIS